MHLVNVTELRQAFWSCGSSSIYTFTIQNIVCTYPSPKHPRYSETRVETRTKLVFYLSWHKCPVPELSPSSFPYIYLSCSPFYTYLPTCTLFTCMCMDVYNRGYLPDEPRTNRQHLSAQPPQFLSPVRPHLIFLYHFQTPCTLKLSSSPSHFEPKTGRQS